MHVERVPARCALGPAGRRELVAAHDRAESPDEGTDEAGLDRRQRRSSLAEADDAVVVEVGHELERLFESESQALEPGADVELG